MPVAGECELWTGPTTQGYAYHSVDGRHSYVHRDRFAERYGLAPRERIENLCGRRHCVNAEHWRRIDVLTSFEDKVHVEPNTGCWLFLGAKRGQGYASFFDGRKVVAAHNWSYRHFVGPIPVGLELDHLCGQRCCVNPAHLQPVTHRENVLRSSNMTAINSRKTHCPRGHEYNDENTYSPPKKGGRVCRICARDRSRENHRRYRAEGRAL